MKHKKILFILILISMVLFASGCEEKMSAEEIATKMQEKEASLKDYSGTIHTTIYLNGEKDLEEEIQIVYKKPNLMRTSGVEEGKEVESVSDGEFVWSYDAETDTVTKIKLPEEPLLTERDFVSIIGNLLNESEVSMLGVGEVDGRNAYVLEARPKNEENGLSELISRTKLWVDTETWMVLKSSMYDNKGNLTMEMEISDLKVNTGIPDSEFKFEIPEGAEVVTMDLDEQFKISENLSLEEARQQASFGILVPEYIPEGYVLNFTSIYNDSNMVPEGQGSETVTLTYLKENEEFGITETVYEGEGYTSTQGAEEVMINGKVGKYLNEFGNVKMLVWKLGEVEITLYGSPEKAELLKIAESIEEPFTEFYILGPEGKAENYPTDYLLGESGTVRVGIVNQEQKPTNYTLEVWLENTPLPLPVDWKNICIENNETLEKAVTITPPFEGTNMNLQFLLYNNDKKDTFEGDIDAAYRNLNLRINVSKNLSVNTSTALTAV
jgi:outer membrane lipoprotein-sorting protein